MRQSLEATTSQLDRLPNWPEYARCLGTDIEMVPGNEDGHAEPHEVRLAKAVCSHCPVRRECRERAAEVSAEAGQTVQGIWGGLTFDERERMRLSLQPSRAACRPTRDVVSCEVCGLDCVLRYTKTPKCDLCLAAEDIPDGLEARREEITAWIEENRSYREIAQLLGIRSSERVSKACREWGLRSNRRGLRPRPHSELKPCGTEAARIRHRRRGETFDNCACRFPIPVNREKSAITLEAAR